MPNTTTGGRALSYYSTLRFGMNKLMIQDADPITAEDGMKIGYRIVKNRLAYSNPFVKGEYFVIYGEGVDKMTEIMDKAPEAGIMRKSGSWFYYEKEDGELIIAEEATVDGKKMKDVPLKFQGKTKLRAFLNENDWFFEQLKGEIRGKYAKGELMPKSQDEKEIKEIEALNEIEKQIAAEEETLIKKAQEKKAKKKAEKAEK